MGVQLSWYGSSATFASALAYFGKRRAVFADVFGDAGKVVYP